MPACSLCTSSFATAWRGSTTWVDDGLAAAMLVAAVVVTPIGGWSAVPAFADPVALAAGVGVAVSSSVIPYVCDQLAMAKMARSTYALFVSLAAATATVVGVVVLAQLPTPIEVGDRAQIGGVAPPPGASRLGGRREQGLALADVASGADRAVERELAAAARQPGAAALGRELLRRPEASFRFVRPRAVRRRISAAAAKSCCP
jgi:inner membrane transporter RhtA